VTIKGIEGLSTEKINYELQKGAKFVIYQFCISIVVMTFKRGSVVYFITSDESRVGKGMIYNLISFFFGWWGIPWGPIYTIGSLYTNLKGGKDITQDIIVAMNSSTASDES